MFFLFRFHKNREKVRLVKVANFIDLKFPFSKILMRFIIILNIGNVREDGLFHQNVWRILNKDKKLNTESLYNNSYWFKFSDFKEKYPDKLEEYYKQQEQK